MTTEEWCLGRIRWDCRRGIKEADVLLQPFFDKYFVALSEDNKRAFVALLASHDVDLFEWFTGRSLPDSEDLQRIIGIIVASVRPIDRESL